VLDGEVVVLDEQGRPQFYDLLRDRGTPVFVAFDIIEFRARDLRDEFLLERKRLLLHQTVQPVGRSTGKGIVAKWKATALDRPLGLSNIWHDWPRKNTLTS
jgi:ATP-dependent DNA ligase